MSQYSEIIGSFKRTGSFPLESNYIFSSVEALEEFYSDEIEATTIHTGLIRVVLDDGSGNLALYWAVPVDSSNDSDDTISYTWELLVSAALLTSYANTLDSLLSSVDTINTDLTAIWGTSDPSIIDENLNSIKDLAESLTTLSETLTALSETVDANKEIANLELITALLVLIETDLEDPLTALLDLAYPSITAIVKRLKWFDHHMFTDKLLAEGLKDLWNKIEGSPLPDELYQTLYGLWSLIEEVKSTLEYADNNALEEINNIETAVGLDGNGNYSADVTTNYLLNATSVYNALNILDAKIAEEVGYVVEVENNDIVELEVTNVDKVYTISAALNLSNTDGNQLIKKTDGLYMNVDSEYTDGILTFTVNGNIIALHILTSTFIGIKSASYDSSTETISIVFNLANGLTETLTIPVSALIEEWDVDNTTEGGVELTKTRSVSGTDTISAKVVLLDDSSNILLNVNGYMYVNGSSDSITYNGSTLTSILDSFIASTEESISDLQSQVTSNDEDIAALLSTDADLQSQITSNDEDIASLEAATSNLETIIGSSITWNII